MTLAPADYVAGLAWALSRTGLFASFASAGYEAALSANLREAGVAGSQGDLLARKAVAAGVEFAGQLEALEPAARRYEGAYGEIVKATLPILGSNRIRQPRGEEDMPETEGKRVAAILEAANAAIRRASKEMAEAVSELEKIDLTKTPAALFDEMHGMGVAPEKSRELYDAFSDFMRGWSSWTNTTDQALGNLSRNLGAAEHVANRCHLAVERMRR